MSAPAAGPARDGAPPVPVRPAAVKIDPLAQLAALGDPGLDDLVEAIVSWTDATIGTAEIVAACERYYAENGKVFHSDSFYAARTAYFFDQFAFERRVADGTPYEMFAAYARAATPAVPQSLLDRLTWLGDVRHSVFQILKLGEKSMVVEDLLTPGRLAVAAKPGETFRGLDRKLLLQGFLFRLGGEKDAVRQLSSGLVLHPQGATRFVRRYLRQWQKDGAASRRGALAKLASLQLSHLRHRHVDAKTLYQQHGK